MVSVGPTAEEFISVGPKGDVSLGPLPEAGNPFNSLNLPAIPFPFVDPNQMRIKDNVQDIGRGLSDLVSLATLANHDRYTKVPRCLAMVVAVAGTQVTLSDGDAECEATVHGKVHPKPHRGMVLLLEQVAIFAPSDHSRCLIICPQNIAAIYLNQFIQT